MRSKLPAAEQFDDWVIGEFLPSIRKQDGYMAAASEETPEKGALHAMHVSPSSENLAPSGGFARLEVGMLLGLQTGSVVTGLVAAVLWFRSATIKASPATLAGFDQLEGLLDQMGRLNMWAAGVTDTYADGLIRDEER